MTEPKERPVYVPPHLGKPRTIYKLHDNSFNRTTRNIEKILTGKYDVEVEKALYGKISIAPTMTASYPVAPVTHTLMKADILTLDQITEILSKGQGHKKSYVALSKETFIPDFIDQINKVSHGGMGFRSTGNGMLDPQRLRLESSIPAPKTWSTIRITPQQNLGLEVE